MFLRRPIARRPLIAALAVGVVVCAAAPVRAQENPTPANDDLVQLEASLAQRYDRLETLVERLAELSRSTQPRRATLLRQLIARSRDRDVAGQFDRVVAALEQESYSAAIDGQSSLEAELQKLLDLLLQEDRDRQIESERKRITRYLKDLNRLIRLQRGVKARTDGGDEAQELADDQRRVGEKTKELGDEIEQAEETAAEKAAREAAADGAKGKPAAEPNASGDQPPGKEAKPSGDAKPSEPSEGQPSQDNSGKPSDGQPGQPDKAPSGDGQSPPNSGQPGQSQQAPASPPGGQPSGEGSESPPSSAEESQSPLDRTAQRLRQAQQRMEDAQRRLEESQRDGAAEKQAQAVEELEQAKAELERILRQLREEELERTLVLLEARFRKMLDEQVEIYDETKRLDAASSAPAHELEIAGGRLARREDLIVREADRALVLLREDGTSTAFPEAIEQARDDMQSIAVRLRDVKFDVITQGLEEDVIAALEETLAALQQAIKGLREQQSGQQQPAQGEPGEQPLVDQLAELRMIRSLQARVNKRTQQYGVMIEGEQALEAELLEALDQLSLRQQKIFQATRELNLKEN